MTQTILSHAEFFGRTIPSNIEPYKCGVPPVPQTDPIPGVILQFDLSKGKNEDLPTSFVTIDELVKQSEIDPKRRRALQEGRRWVASTFYVNQENTLRVIRLQKGLSQAQLAAVIGTTQPHVARIESGQVDVQIGTLVRIAVALGVEPLVTVRAFLTKRLDIVNASTHG